MEGFAHQADADKIVGIACALAVGGLSDCYLDLFERLKNAYIMIAAQELRPDLLGQRRLQEFDWKYSAFSESCNICSGSKCLPSPRWHEPLCGLLRIVDDQALTDEPGYGFSERQCHRASNALR